MMKKINIKKLGILLVFLCGSISLFAQDTINIFYTNDTHSQIEPFINRNEESVGGVLRRATMIAQQRELDPDLLLFDCGDFVQGTPYFNLYKGKAEVDMMNTMRYNVSVLGNHEFDNGLEGIKLIVEEAKFPILCANYDFSNTILKGLIKPYIVVVCKGVKIGVLGLTINPEGMIMKKNYEGVVYTDYVECANEVVAKLRNEEGCQMVVCLSHLGIQSDQTLAAQTSGIDIILGGHSHTFIYPPKYIKNKEGKEVLVTQMGSKGESVGHLSIPIE